MPLSDTGVKNLKPAEKPYKIADGGGLHLLVNPNGSKLWRLAYRFGAKQKLLALGAYPVVKLAEARQAREDAKAVLARGTDPAKARKAKAVAADLLENTFNAVVAEWLEKREKDGAAEATLAKNRWLLDYAVPILGTRDVGALEPTDILAVLRELEARGIYESANRLRSVFGQVMRYAIATGRAKRDTSADLRGALVVKKAKHRAAVLDPKEVGGLLRAIRGYTGQPATRAALLLAAYTFLRPGELRHAQWSEIDGAVWRVPAGRMKMKRPHIVPLSRQAVAVLEDLRRFTGRGTLIFPAVRSTTRPISENTTNAALRRMGYTVDEMTTHGFRRVAATMLNEMGWDRDWIERQLAHVEGNAVRGAYNAAEYVLGRTEMMQAWADHLDSLSKQ